MHEDSVERRLAAILCLDVVGYTRLMGRDEVATRQRLRARFNDLVYPEVERSGGRVVKSMGDGLLVEMPSIVEAAECAIRIQKSMANRNERSEQDQRIDLRAGVNLGDVIVEESDIHGDGVNLAARLEAAADPGGICLSGAAHDMLNGALRQSFTDGGERMLKNIERPVRVWRWSYKGPSAVVSPIKTPLPDPLADASIVVLPLANMSGDPDQEFFADGITEDITTNLAALPNLRVVARASAFIYKSANAPIRQIATELNVTHVLQGSIRKAGDTVRVSAQLVNARDESQIWAERYDRRMTGIFEIQDELATRIVDALRIRIPAHVDAADGRSPRVDVDAYQNYLRARVLSREMTRESIAHAREILHSALQVQPDYALAWSCLARCEMTLAIHFENSREHVAKALECSQKALDLDPTLAEARAAFGWALEVAGDRRGAAREFRTAIQLEPTSYEAHENLGSLLLHGGEAEAAAEHLKRAFELSELELYSPMMLSVAYTMIGDGDALTHLAREALKTAEQRMLLNHDDVQAIYVGAMMLHHLGKATLAKTLAAEAASATRLDSRSRYNIACLYGLLGDVDAALEHLKIALSLGCSQYKRQWMRIDSDLALVRADARFEPLMARYE